MGKQNKTKLTRIKKTHLLKREGVYVHITAVSGCIAEVNTTL